MYYIVSMELSSSNSSTTINDKEKILQNFLTNSNNPNWLFCIFYIIKIMFKWIINISIRTCPDYLSSKMLKKLLIIYSIILFFSFIYYYYYGNWRLKVESNIHIECWLQCILFWSNKHTVFYHLLLHTKRRFMGKLTTNLRKHLKRQRNLKVLC